MFVRLWFVKYGVLGVDTTRAFTCIARQNLLDNTARKHKHTQTQRSKAEMARLSTQGARLTQQQQQTSRHIKPNEVRALVAGEMHS